MEQRTIKFKAKRLDNGEWVKGDLNHSKDSVYVDMIRVDPATVCQYTGLKDKDGKEIWEHDYVVDYNQRGEVIFADGEFVMKIKGGNIPLEAFVVTIKDKALGTYRGCQVIKQGSIFDRKEGEI